MNEADYLIIGQGIAGSLLSYFLIKKHKRVIVIDDNHPSSASRVAAGLINPITGRRIVKTWKADLIIPFAEKIYQQLEAEMGVKFFYKKNIVKYFSSYKELNDCAVKSGASEYAEYILEHADDTLNEHLIKDYIGSTEIKQSAFLNISLFVEAYRNILKSRGQIIEGKFNYTDIRFENNSGSWKDIRFRKIIFCDGYRATQNFYFSYLPFVLAKGEIITIHSPELQIEKIVSKGIFIIPIGNNKYKVGSTYEWNEIDENSTLKGRNQISEQLDKILKCKYTIVEHQAGIRPTVKDRRPLLGIHPENKLIGIFNGLGTKGASLAPYFAHQFVEFLENEASLDEEVNIERFSNK